MPPWEEPPRAREEGTMIDGCRSPHDAAGHMEVPAVVCLPLSIERLLRSFECCTGGCSTPGLGPDGLQGVAPRGEA